MTSVLVRDARENEHDLALQIALNEPGLPAVQAERVRQLTEGFLQRCGGSIGGLHVAEARGRLVAACAALDLPGGVSLLVLPAWSLSQDRQGTLAELLARASEAARQRRRRFSQIMLEPDVAGQVRSALTRAGFGPLADLHYMQRNAYDPSPIQVVEGTAWRTLEDTTEEAYAEVIRRTYVDSRDCPGLTGVRSMRDVLDSHRGAGLFDARGWYLLEHMAEPAGVLITARTAMRAGLEVVYVGLVREARGKGLGRICMHRAIQRARDLALPQVTLAVDAANDSACRLYTAMGFAMYAAKSVWFRVFRRADEEGLFSLPDR